MEEASGSIPYFAEAKQVLSFWYDGDQSENYRTKWFPPDGSEKQAFMDQYIKETFGDLLNRAERGELNAWKKVQQTFVALILVLDQFSRHVYRHINKEQLKQNDATALCLIHELMEKKWHENLPIPQFVFVLMPLRHTPTAERLKELLVTIEKRKRVQDQHVDLLEKFRKTTQNRLQHLQSPTMKVEEKEKEEGNDHSEDDILERHFMETDESDMPKNRLYKAMQAFLLKMNAQKYTHLAVSLSGGVDSMVIAYLLHKLKVFHNNFSIVAVHIDYANRSESAAECEYVRRWCERFDIIFYARRIDEVTRGKTKRDDYERISREIRYSTYAQIMEQYQIPGMCFGHHRGDVQENVISNMMKGQSLLNLNGMSETSIVNGVKIWRPLLAFDKEIIFEYAHQYGIPYFKDTTPLWSTRGKLRTKLIPLLSDMYGEGFLNNLSNLGVESTQCGELVDQKILAPIMASVKASGCAVWIDCKLLETQPFFVWKEILRIICHDKMGNSMIRDKPIRELMMKLQRHHIESSSSSNGGSKSDDGGSWITLKKGNRSFLTEEKILIIFRDQFFPKKNNLPFNSMDTIELDQMYSFGPWQINTKILDFSNEKVHFLKDKRIEMWDLVRQSSIEYVFPFTSSDLKSKSSELMIYCENRIQSLKSLRKVITDFMPIVAAKGKIPNGENHHHQYVHVVIKYSQQET
jgi:tRNA(Ile)-lysidine synthetase-like protein